MCFFWLLASTCVKAQTSWPQFRGPTGQGHSNAKVLPLEWDENSNVTWKIPVAGEGHSSPVLVDDQIWLTSSLDEGKSLHAICISAETGKTIRDVEVFPNNKPLKIHGKNSHASPSALIDDERVYLHFGTYGTVCLYRESGDVVWKKKLEYNPFHGPGGSPVLFEDLLIINCDGSDVQYVTALNKMTGEEVWKTTRAHITEARKSGKEMPGMAFSTPLVTKDNGRDIVLSAGGDHLAAYDARTGEEVWWSQYFGYSVVPRPIVAHGITFAATSYDKPILYAIRMGGKGNVTKSHDLWEMKKGAPRNPSVLAVGDELYVVSDDGILTCVDIVSGKKHWQKRVGGKFSASPLFASGQIYITDEEGKTIVFEPGTKFNKLAENQIDGGTLASLAPVDGVIFLRSDTHLYRIEDEK